MRLFPRDEEFFDLSDQSAARIVEAALVYRAMIDQPAHFRENARKLREFERQSDQLTQQALEKLYRRSATPLEREDIHALTTRLDDVIEHVDAAGQRFVMFPVDRVPEELRPLADLLVMASRELKGAVGALRTLEKPGAIHEHVIELKRLENEADSVFRAALARLFQEEREPIRLLVWKDVYEITAQSIDRCASAGQIIEVVALKHG